MSDFNAILDEAIARTGVYRYRYLCLEHPEPEIRRQYCGLVIRIAAGEYTGQRYDPAAVPVHGMPCCGGDPYGAES